MHILAFEQTPDNRLGGQERSLFEMCQGLASEGVGMSLAYRRPGNLLSQYEAFCRETLHVPQTYRYHPSNSIEFVRAVLRLAWLHREQQWDALYVNQYPDITLPAVLGRLIRRSVVCHLRLPGPNYLSRQYRWGLNQCERLIPISEHTASTYRRNGVCAPTTIIYNGIDVSHFAPQNSPTGSTRWVLYLGRITPEKGLDTLIEAHHEVARSRPDVGLRIVGGKESSSEYRSALQAKAEDGPGRVDFRSHVKDVRPLLASSDLLVLPSEWGEPFGRVLIEAMSTETPVVATRDGGIPEVLSPEFEDHLVPPGNARQLANRILEFVDWRDEQPRLGPSMREYVRARFSADQTVQSLKDVFFDIA